MTTLSRRQFLTTTATALVGTQMSPSATLPASGGLIDAHVHVWTPDTKRYPRAGFLKKAPSPASFTPEQLFTHCHPVGVRRIVLVQPSLYRFDNSYMLDSIAAHPGVFSGVASIDDSAPHIRSRMQDLARQGVRGFRLSPRTPDVAAWLDTPGIQEMWKTAADEGLRICLLISPEALGPVDKMCLRYPQTPVVVDHLARVGMAGPITRAHLDRLLHLSVHQQLVLKTSAFYTLGKRTPPYLDLSPMIKECHQYFGPQRLMWASDSPFQVAPGHTYEASLALIRDHLPFLTASDKAAMLGKTAEKVFFGKAT
ncbi:putative TIM-barrel fold metal-dependent hydrolase [Prosthecobacter fusiformis]|uniref:Putative TIM-barrel fold metal-dependent hydrolase n=1 Tax=Prosthecobacter fusiformis TaxID=48464 RepID=A0A4R7RRC6_9BACT|nr:amidohydrolase family protein [Prosthecobacter fusiformis]TDU68070.1 putative TIM-barrel fold metal-dependent hydrolase [Prosthecobacter fusiformis]